MKLIVVSAMLALLLFSCGPSAKFLAPEYTTPKKVALLPTINQTTDVEGGIVFRNLLYLELERKEYSDLILNTVVDSLLNDEGITDGGQLKAVENNELFDIIGADGLIFIDLIECEYKTLGISETRKVKANFKMRTPEALIWEDEREVDHGKSALSTAFSAISDPSGTLKDSARDLGEQLALKGVKGWLLDHALKPEMMEVITTTVKTLPSK